MKRLDFISKLICPIFVLAVLSACGILSPRVEATPAAITIPTIPIPIATATESTAAGHSASRQPESRDGGNYFEIPATSDVSPFDIIQQVSFEGSGGGNSSEAGCTENCLNEDTQNGMVLFSGFPPNQQMRLVIYDAANLGAFLTEVLIEIDNNGEYTLHISKNYDDNKFLGFFVYDMKGNVLFKPRGWNDHSGFDDNCPGIRRTRLATGMKAVTLAESQEVRSEPGEYNGFVVATLEKGTQVDIVDGPECLETQERVWWKINTGNGDSGWVPEADYSWYLEPLP
jgi:hypothetical protein